MIRKCRTHQSNCNRVGSRSGRIFDRHSTDRQNDGKSDENDLYHMDTHLLPFVEKIVELHRVSGLVIVV